jgi:hypothetical protein
VFWESNPTNIKSPSGECFAGDGNTLAPGGEGVFKLGEGISIRGERLAEVGEGLAKGGGGVAAARGGRAPPALFSSRPTAGGELAHLRDFCLGEQLEGGGFVGGNDGFGGVPVEVREVGVGGILSVGQ